VDIVVKPGDKLPFDNGSIDLIVSTSCFEHDPCFWITFKEMTRIIKFGGFIYVNSPSNGPYHCYPGDNYRFYSDAGQALSYWSSFQFSNEEVFPVKVVETFHILPKSDIWIDFVCVWERVDEKQTDIVVSNTISENIGILEKMLNDNDYGTKKKL
jgi:SAM-dependent methyltransferase